MKLPTLYKKTSTGAVQQWTIWVQDDHDGPDEHDAGVGPVGVIFTEHGQVGGKLQTVYDVIKSGKNQGKKNETTPLQQAQLEAQAKWEKQLKKGYVKSLQEAQAGAVDAIIEGGLSPMLAHVYDKQGHKIKFPAYAQPKLDGHRMIAIVENGVASLWSRTRKRITGIPHIEKALSDLFPTGRHVLDGEAYNHSYKDDFETITSFLRQEEPAEGHEVVEYHIYDIPVTDVVFEDRLTLLKALKLKPPLVMVDTVEIKDNESLIEFFGQALEAGYEGAMVRNRDGLYVGKRSYDLQKVKSMLDAEFEVVAIETGRGKMFDKAIFVCRTPDGTQFRAKMKGNLDDLAKFVLNPDLAVGRMLTVQYQGMTGANGVPRFPVGLRLREDI